MLILGRDQLKDPSLGYAKTFVRQLEDCLGDALERGVRIVSQRRRPQPRRAWPTRCARSPAGSGSTRSSPTSRATTSPRAAGRARLRGRADRQRLPRCVRHRRGADPGRRRGGDRPGHRRLASSVGPAIAAHGWTPTSYDELAGAVVAGHVIECGAQATGGNFSGFLSLPRDATAARLPDRRGGRRRLVGDHQARRHRRRGHRRHGHRPADVRDPDHDLPQPRRHRRPRLGPARAGRRRPGADLRWSAASAPPERLKVVGQRARWLPQPDGVRAHRPRRRREGGLGARAARGPARRAAARGRRLVAGPAPDARRGHRGGGVLPAPGHRQGPVGRRGRSAVQRRRGRAGAGVLPGLHADLPARQRDAVRDLPAGVRRPRRGRAGRGAARTGAAWSPIRRRSVSSPSRWSSSESPTRRCARSSPARAPQHRARAARHASCTPAAATRAATPTSGSGCGQGERQAERVDWLLDHVDARAGCGRCCPEATDLEVEVHPLPNLRRRQRADPRTARRRASPRAPGSTRRPRRSGSACGSGSSTYRRSCCERWNDEHERCAATRVRTSARSRRTCRSGRTRARSRARCTRRPRRPGCSGSRSPRRSAGRVATCSTRSTLQEGMFEAGASSGLMAAPVHRAASRCRTSPRPATPTWSTGSCGPTLAGR